MVTREPKRTHLRFNWTVVARGGSVPSARSDRV